MDDIYICLLKERLCNFKAGDKFNKDDLASLFGVNERTVRKVVKDLHKKMILTTFSVKGDSGTYIVYDPKNKDHDILFANEISKQYKHWKTYYFNNIVKYLPILKDENLKNKFGQIEMILKEVENE